MVPNGWTLTSLGNLCEINPKKIKKPENGKVSFIAMNQLSEEGQLISHLPREYEEVSKGFTSFKDGDVLVAKITPCFENGKGALVHGLTNGVGFGSTEFHVLRAKENTSPEFIYYLTRTKELRVRGENNMQGSAGHRRVTADYFNAYKVLTPPLPEQRKIAKILSTWDKAISTTERLIDNSKQQKKALMQQLLTGIHTQRKRLLDDSGKPFEGEWEEVKLSDVFTLSSGDTKPKDVEKEQTNTQCFPVFGGNNIMGYSAKSNSTGNVILIGRVGEYCGVTRLVQNDCWITDNALFTKKFSADFDKQFIVYLLQKFDLSRLRNKGGQPLISQKPIYGVKIEIPSLHEQQKVASVLLNADREIEGLQQQLADLKQEKKALMQQLLTGKRRVKT